MGKKYTQKIADMLNANVNASSTPVGHEKLGGNWELNVMSNPKVPFNDSGLSCTDSKRSSAETPQASAARTIDLTH